MEIIIVIDSGAELVSTVADELAIRYGVIVIREPNAGPARAREVGLNRAKGNFIQFVDEGDFLASGKIDIQVDEFGADPEVDVCVSEYEFCDDHGIKRWLSRPSTIQGFSFSLENFTSLWKKGFFVPIASALFRRTLLDRAVFDSANEFSKPDQDQKFWIEIAKVSPQFKFNGVVLSACRPHHLALRSEGPIGARITSVGGAQPTVSVIMPCYNQGEYLNEAVESVLEQSFQDFEIIVVDDGSTDAETIRTVENLYRPKTTVIRTTNQGLAGARNNAIRESRGKYILPLDADDKIGATYLEQAVSVLDANEKVGIVYCKAELFGNVCGPWDLPAYRFPDILLGNRIFCSAFFRRTDWLRVNGYRPLWGWEDFDFWLSLIELGREVFCLPETLFFYRKRSDSMIATMTREHCVDGFAQLFRRHPKLYVDNIASLFKEREALWLELEKFIQGLGSLRDSRLQFAWTVITHLIAEIELSAQESNAKHEVTSG